MTEFTENETYKMKFLNDKSAKISRALILLVTLLSIPFLFVAAVFEKAGGGTQIIQYVLYPFVCILTYFTYTLYRRWSDKTKKMQSKKIYVIIELIIGLITLTITCLTMFAMISAGFEIEIFIVLLGLLYISIILSLDCLKDLKTSMKIME